MAISVYFQSENMSTQKYDEVVKRLQAAGAGSPKGRTYHVAFGDPNQLQVFDIWESQETFDAFGAVLMPIAGEVGANPGEPMIAPVHNIIVG